jgi:peptidoglycan-N-acetylglucosamine deacetylase
MVPHRTPFFLPWFFPKSLIWRYQSLQRDLYLTFDDGPVPGPTDFVLGELGRRNVHATFFCIGDNIQKHPAVFERIIADGHAVGNHTFNHLNGWQTGFREYIANVKRCNDLLPDSPQIFRPPYGRITMNQIKGLSDFKIIMWDVLSVDYDKHLQEQRCLRNTIRACRPGSIVVFHDSYKAEKNLRYVLPRFIDHFLEIGYSFKTIT